MIGYSIALGQTLEFETKQGGTTFLSFTKALIRATASDRNVAPPWLILRCLRQQILHDMPMHVGEAEIATLKMIGELFVIESQQLQNRCLQIIDMDTL